MSELYFALYAARHDLFQVLGHLYKVLAYVVVYRAVFLQSVHDPFERLRHEVSERERAEEEVREANRDLEQRVAERTARLEAANRDLEAFAYSVAHELRNPLGPMRNAVHLLQRTPQADQAPRIPLEILERNIEVQARLIEDLLAFARASNEQLRKERVDQEALVRTVLQSLQVDQQDRQIEVGVGELPAAEGDPRFVKQVWLNLLANALKYTRKREHAVIRVGFQRHNGVPAYYVADNGVGFDMSEADKLFVVFRRLHGSDEYEGTGLGLAIVQRIVDRHGGRIWTDAQKNRGATFYFTLQAAQ